jgi:hypothetical protein
MMLHLRAINAQLFGKPFSMMQLQGSETIYCRRVWMDPLTIANREIMVKNALNLSGNSIAWSRKHFERGALFAEQNYGAADATARFGISNHAVAMDYFNLLTIRSKNQSEHTLKVSEEFLLSKFPAINAHKQDVFL